MSYRLSGINPLAYVGVEPYTPPLLTVQRRSPTANDTKFNIGSIWVYSVANVQEEIWMLISLVGNVANWVQLYPGNDSGGADQFPTDNGIADEVGGVLNVLGGANINTEGSGNTVTINLNEIISWPDTDAGGTQGVIFLDGDRFLHKFGNNNTFLGINAGNFTSSTASENTGVGLLSLQAIDTGELNTAAGSDTLTALESGNNNSAFGGGSLGFLVSGSNNIAVGALAGSAYSSSESSNIVIGNLGVMAEDNTIRIGTQGSGAGQQDTTYIAGIYGSAADDATAEVVQVDATGKLGSAELTSTGGTVAITKSPGAINLEAAGSGSIKTTIYTSSDTWNKDVNAKYIMVIAWNGGSGGGSGRRGASGAAGGGSGGGANGVFHYRSPAYFFPNTATVTIGAGGAGGAAQLVDNTNGNVGSAGGQTLFGLLGAPTELGTGGGGGTTGNNALSRVGYIFTDAFVNEPQTVVPPVFPIPNRSRNNGGTASRGSITNGADGITIGLSSNNLYLSAGSGGGGGGADTTTAYAGGAGSRVTNLDGTFTLLAGGNPGLEGGTIDGGNGNIYSDTVVITGGTGGGGGGGQSTGPVAGNGGNGGFPGGAGGGGGGSLNGTPSGAGGNGADGAVWVIEFL